MKEFLCDFLISEFDDSSKMIEAATVNEAAILFAEEWFNLLPYDDRQKFLDETQFIWVNNEKTYFRRVSLTKRTAYTLSRHHLTSKPLAAYLEEYNQMQR